MMVLNMILQMVVSDYIRSDNMLDYYKEFDYKDLTSFISGHEHKHKSIGFKGYLELVEDAHIENFWKPKRLYLCGYVIYHCNKRGITIPEFIRKFDGEKMDKLLLHSGSLVLVNLGIKSFEELYNSAILEFLEYNLLICEVDTVIGGVS